jgi:lipopolysaccharide exporter
MTEPQAAEELRAAAVQGVRWTSIARPTIEVIQLASLVILARLISPPEFGRYAIALIAQEIAIVMVSTGLSSALVQRKNVDREHMQAGVALALLLGLSLAGLTLVAAEVVVTPVFGARTAHFVRLMSPLCLISAVGTVPTASLSRRMAFRRLSEMEVANVSFRVAASLGLVLAGLGGESLVIGALAGALAAAVIAWLSAPPPWPRLRRSAARELLGYALPTSLASISWVGFSNVDYAIIGARLGPMQTGLYYRAYTVAVEYQKKISVVMGQVGFPVLARTRSDVELADMHHQMVRLLTIVLFPLLLLLAILAPELIPLVFGHAWAGAVVPVQILAAGGASTLVIDAAAPVLMATGRPRALLGFGVAHFAVYGLTVLLVVPLGIVAVAVAAAAVHAVFLLVAYTLIARGSSGHPLRRLWGDIAPASVSCLGLLAVALPASIALSAAHAPAVLILAVVGLLAAPSYLITLRSGFPTVWATERRIVGRIVPRHRLPTGIRRRVATVGARSAS